MDQAALQRVTLVRPSGTLCGTARGACEQQRLRTFFFLAGARCLSAGHHLRLTRGPAGNRTTTGSLSHEDT